MNSFWSDAADKPQIEGGQEFEDLPVKFWFSASTATVENGESRPRIVEIAPKQEGGETIHKFNAGLIVDGAESGKVDPKFEGRYCFFSSWIRPNPEGPEVGNYISGRLTGFLNAIYATGIALDEEDKEKRAQLRWQATMGELSKVAAENELKLEDYPDEGLYIAAVAITDLQQNSKKVLFKTRGRSYKDKQGKERVNVEVGAYEDCVQANLMNRSVVSFDAMGTEGAKPGTSF
jgi:hypothetical protein